MNTYKSVCLLVMTAVSYPLAVTAADQSVRHELILSGPIEYLDRSANKVSVLGHTIALGNAEGFKLGQMVQAFGEVDALSSRVTFLSNTGIYSTGLDGVLVKGKVTGIDASIGRMQIDGSSVDYTALLTDSSFRVPTLGAIVEAVGVQPLGRGIVLASSIIQAPGSEGITGIGATTSQGITGIGATTSKGITGIGATTSQGITGIGATTSKGITGIGATTSQGITGIGATTKGITGIGASTSQGITGIGLVHSAGITGIGAAQTN